MQTRILRESVAVVTDVMNRVASTARGRPNEASAELRRLCGRAISDAPSLIRTQTLGPVFAQCFEQALKAGATMDDFARVRIAAGEIVVEHPPSVTIVVAAIRFALIGESRAISAIRFRSKAECDMLRERLTVAFDAAIEIAADRGEHEAMRALTALHAAVSYDLDQRGRTLPRMVDYRFARSLPSLVIAQRIYGDAGREPEIVAENRPSHPLFMPPSGRALSVG